MLATIHPRTPRCIVRLLVRIYLFIFNTFTFSPTLSTQQNKVQWSGATPALLRIDVDYLFLSNSLSLRSRFNDSVGWDWLKCSAPLISTIGKEAGASSFCERRRIVTVSGRGQGDAGTILWHVDPHCTVSSCEPSGI